MEDILDLEDIIEWLKEPLEDSVNEEDVIW